VPMDTPLWTWQRFELSVGTALRQHIREITHFDCGVWRPGTSGTLPTNPEIAPRP
jgi:hypothetical protein